MNGEVEIRILRVKVNIRRILIFSKIWYLEFKRLLGKFYFILVQFLRSPLLYINFIILLNFIKQVYDKWCVTQYKYREDP
jgi:hypothetical protein